MMRGEREVDQWLPPGTAVVVVEGVTGSNSARPDGVEAGLGCFFSTSFNV